MGQTNYYRTAQLHGWSTGTGMAVEGEKWDTNMHTIKEHKNQGC